MAKKKQQPIEPEEEVEEFMEIGGSPMPGITLRQVLRGHTDRINRIAWSPDGMYLASPSGDKTIRIWEVEHGKCLKVIDKLNDEASSVVWSSSGNIFVAAFNDGELGVWDAKNWKLLSLKNVYKEAFTKVAWSPDGNKLATASSNGKILIWNTRTWEILSTLTDGESQEQITSIDWSPNGYLLASASNDTKVRIWNLSTNSLDQILSAHSGILWDIRWGPREYMLASSSQDNTIRIWDMQSGQPIQVLEGHTGGISCLSFSSSGDLLSSKAGDGFRLWRTDTWDNILNLPETDSIMPLASLAFHPQYSYLATLGNSDTTIRIWEYDYNSLISNAKPESIRYTTAKLVLVGDSGVGKTGLGWRLAHNEFKEHSSTHGQQFWVVPELKKTREDGTECEAVLWDLAGQHIYRSIHSIFLDDVDASLVLFDPTNRQEPLKGAQFWLEQLKGKKQLPPSVLVGARLDRGAPVLSQQELDQFCQKYGISGGYIGTSAKSGEGLDNLLESLKDQIPWDEMTTTVTTVTFKRIKEYVLSLKEKTDRKGVLVHPDELREQLQVTDKDWEFSDAEMMTAVGHLANHGYVSILHSSSGEEYILLVPELLASVASSIFLHADKHPRELGAINETELLQGKYPIDEFKGLEKEEQQVLLDATVVRFLEHSLCFRETLGNDNLLIFPSLIKQKRPLIDEFEAADDVSYILRGRVENIYASMVVLLGYTSMFTRINQWQSQAQYEMGPGEICGFRLIEEREGELELVLYYSITMPTYGRSMFQGLFEKFLYQREVEVTRLPPVFCPNRHRIERATVLKRVRDGKNFAFCDECGEKSSLPELERPQMLGTKQSHQIQREESLVKLRRLYESNLTRIKSFRRDREVPRCFISHIGDYPEWLTTLIHDLRDAGITILDNSSEIGSEDYLVLVGTIAYKKGWEISTDELKDVSKLVLSRVNKNLDLYPKVIPLVLDGSISTACPTELLKCQIGDFRDETRYPVALFDLVLSLYAIPFNYRAFEPLRETLRDQWKQTLAGWEDQEQTEKQIFISYAWGEEREAIVNELDNEFQQRGVTIIRDKRDLGFKGSIKEFMETIGEGKAVILVISEKYLKSPNCCFELVQIAKQGQFKDRIFPIVLNDASIYDPATRLRYVEHWESKKTELDELMKRVSAANMQGFREDIDLYTEIRALLPNLMDVLKDMNTLTPDIHKQSGFSEIFDAVMAKLEE